MTNTDTPQPDAHENRENLAGADASAEPRDAVTGAHTTNGTPHGYTSLTPFLALERAGEAVEFYRAVFGARVVDITEMGGVVAHADLDFGAGHLQLGVPMPDYHLVAPPTGDDACYSFSLYVENVDSTVERAVSAGAVVREPATNFVSGDRYASIRDPFGVRWSIMTRVEDLSEDESANRVREWAASFAAADDATGDPER